MLLSVGPTRVRQCQRHDTRAYRAARADRNAVCCSGVRRLSSLCASERRLSGVARHQGAARPRLRQRQLLLHPVRLRAGLELHRRRRPVPREPAGLLVRPVRQVVSGLRPGARLCASEVCSGRIRRRSAGRWRAALGQCVADRGHGRDNAPASAGLVRPAGLERRRLVTVCRSILLSHVSVHRARIGRATGRRLAWLAALCFLRRSCSPSLCSGDNPAQGSPRPGTRFPPLRKGSFTPLHSCTGPSSSWG